MRVSGPWASPLETNPSPSTFFPSRETPHCFQPGRTPGVVEGGQGCGMERVEGGPAQQRTAPPPALLVCLWILFLQAKEEEPSGGRGPARARGADENPVPKRWEDEEPRPRSPGRTTSRRERGRSPPAWPCPRLSHASYHEVPSSRPHSSSQDPPPERPRPRARLDPAPTWSCKALARASPAHRPRPGPARRSPLPPGVLRRRFDPLSFQPRPAPFWGAETEA